jgi:hypothetical protein
MKRRFSLGWIVLTIILGALMGSALGQIIGLLFPDGVVKDFFLRSASVGFSPTEINLVIISFTVGFTFHLNIIGVIGIIIAAYIFRWYA